MWVRLGWHCWFSFIMLLIHCGCSKSNHTACQNFCTLIPYYYSLLAIMTLFLFIIAMSNPRADYASFKSYHKSIHFWVFCHPISHLLKTFQWLLFAIETQTQTRIQNSHQGLGGLRRTIHSHLSRLMWGHLLPHSWPSSHRDSFTIQNPKLFQASHILVLSKHSFHS